MKVYHTNKSLIGRKNVRVGASEIDFPDRYEVIEVTEAQGRILCNSRDWQRASAEDRADSSPGPLVEHSTKVDEKLTERDVFDVSPDLGLRAKQNADAEQGVEFQIEIGDDEPDKPAPKRRRRSKKQ